LKPIRRFAGSGRRFISSISSARTLITEAWRCCAASSFPDARGERFMSSQHIAHADEGANNQDVHLDRAFAPQYGGEHGDTMLGESKGQVTASAPT
jgi:hypothetical protein